MLGHGASRAPVSAGQERRRHLSVPDQGDSTRRRYGAIGLGVLELVDPLIDSVGTAVGIPAFAIGLISRSLSIRLNVPTDLVTVPGLVPLPPGLAVFRGRWH